MTFHGYDITGTLLWLCSRPECLVLYRLQGNDDGPLKPITLKDGPRGSIRCCICMEMVGR